MILKPPITISTKTDFVEVMEINDKAHIVYMIVNLRASPEEEGNSTEIAERVQYQIHTAYQYLFKEGFIEIKDELEPWFTHAAAILLKPK